MKFSLENVLIGVLFAVGGSVIVSLLAGLPLMLLWNWLMPAIFGLKTITFFEALGLCFLSSILFKSSSTSKS